MAHTVDSISIKGLRKAHLRQLVEYIRQRDREGWYYVDRKQFEKRHDDLLELADRIEDIANDDDARIPADPTKSARCICVDFINCNPNPVPNPDCPTHGAMKPLNTKLKGS